MATPTEDPVGLIPFAAPDITDAEVAAVERVLRSGWLTTGSECELLERELAEYLGVPHVVAVSSCTAAIEIAYAFLDLPAGARVGIPTWTFASTALAPHHHGAAPVLLDVDPDTLNLSVASLEAALDAGLDAVIPVHFGGVPVDAAVLDRCAAADVPVIEDAAHSFGAKDHRGMTAGQGTVGACLSFYATKNLTSAEGGALVTERADVAEFARSFRLHGLSKDAWKRYAPGAWAQYDLVGPGIKANLPDLLAALARVQLSRFAEMQARRRALVLLYRRQLDGVEGLGFVPTVLAGDGADHLCVVVLPEGCERDGVIGQLAASGIASSVHFQPLHRFRWFEKHVTIGPSGVDVADRLAERVLSLPLGPTLSEADVDRVCGALRQALTP